MATDWLMLQDEYLHTAITLKALAKQHGVPYGKLHEVVAREGWVAMKHAKRSLATEQPQPPSKARESTKSTRQTTEENPSAAEKSPETQTLPAEPADHTDRIARLRAIGDRLTDQLARATVELDKQVLKRKRKTREVVYDGMDAKGKPVEETVEENYELEIVDATVSCAGLQKLSATLKNLREATMADAGEGQSVGMVAELMKRLDDEAAREEA